jgi:copper transport protein
MTIMRLSAVVALAALVLLAGPVAAALAHAELTSTDPASGSTVAQSPPKVVMTFSENPDPKASLVRILDSSGRTVPGVSPVEAVPGKPLELQVTLSSALGKGVYTVNWRSVSAIDGHVANGAFAFGVGVTPAPGSVRAVALLNTSGWTTALSSLGKWLLYAGLALFLGAASTCLFVLKGRLPAGGVLLLRAAALVAFVGFCAMVWAERDLIGARSLMPLFDTVEGKYLLALGVALVLCIVAVVCVDLWPARWSLLCLGAAGALAVLAHVLAGHADAPSAWRILNILAQWVHMCAIGVWVGGLAWLLLGIRGQSREERATAVEAFSRLATVTLVVVLATGVARSYAEVRTPSNLVHTTYGITLLVKVGLVVLVVALGALSHYRWVPSLKTTEGAAHRFRLNSSGELALAASVLAVTAVLSGLAPATSAVATAAPGASSGVTQSAADYATTVRVHLTVSPAAVGENSYAVTVDSYDSGQPLESVTAVRLDFSLPSKPTLSGSTLALSKAYAGTWQGAGLQLSVVGHWSVTVTVEEANGGVTVPFELDVKAAP